MVKHVPLAKVVERVSELMAGLASRAFADVRFAELSMRQVLYLSTILKLGSPTFSELARALNVTKPSVTAIVNVLIGKGYAQKEQDAADRRAYHIIVTAKAREFDKLHATVHKKLADSLVAGLDAGEGEQLARLLNKALQGLPR